MKNYQVLQTTFPIALTRERAEIINVVVTDSPLPVRIFEQIQRLPKYRDSLISFDVCNFNPNESLELELMSEIKGYTDQVIDNVKIPAMGSGRPARLVINQCPRLKLGILKKINNAQAATLYYEIIKKTNGSRVILERNTKTIKLLPRDMIIWELKGLRSSYDYDLACMIGAWINPADEKGHLDRIRGKAKEYHPERTLVGKSDDLSVVTSQVKAIYEYLNNETNIRYVNQAFCFGFGSGGQRVLLPSAVIEAEAGNCIDLTVLFASILEGLGINSLIMLTSDHAFLGWGNKRKAAELEVLECTLLGRSNPSSKQKFTFDEAQYVARQTFEDNFLFVGMTDPAPNELLMKSKQAQIVDLAEVRADGIFSSTLG